MTDNGKLQLTPRQREIFTMIADGWPDENIGASLGLSVNTVRKYVNTALQRNDCHSRVRLAVLIERETR